MTSKQVRAFFASMCLWCRRRARHRKLEERCSALELAISSASQAVERLKSAVHREIRGGPTGFSRDSRPSMRIAEVKNPVRPDFFR